MSNLLDMFVNLSSRRRREKYQNTPEPHKMVVLKVDTTPEPGVQVSPSGEGFLPPTDLPTLSTDSLSAAQEYVFRNLEGGVRCPSCGQHAQLRARTITKKMAEWLCSLVTLANKSPGKFFHVNEISSQRGGDYAKLLKWGLLEPMKNADLSKRTSGMFRPTKLGILWAQGKVGVPSHVLVFNNKIWGKKLSQLRISEVKNFNWAIFKTALFGA